VRFLSRGAPPGSEGGQLSPDGDLAWWHTAKNIEIWDTRLGRIVGTLPPGTAPAIALARRGVRRAAFIDIGPGSPMQVVDFARNRKLDLAGPPPKCAGGWRWAVFSPDNRFLAATTLCGQSVVWNASTGRRVSAFADAVPVSLTDFASDDAHLAVGLNDGTVALWDVRRGRLVHVLAGHTSAIGIVAFSPDAKQVLSTSFDGTSRVWDTASGRVLRVFPVAGGAVFSADGKQVLIFDAQGIVHFFDACALCGDAKGLLALARTRVTRRLTAVEQETFVNGS
jgi:WD40 repeat protein